MEIKKNEYKSILKSVTESFILFFVFQLIVGIYSFIFKIPYLVICLGFSLVIFSFIVYQFVQKNIYTNSIEKSPKINISKAVKNVTWNIALIWISSILIAFIFRQFGNVVKTDNQSAINNVLNNGWSSVIFIGLFTVIAAPIVEEVCFRELLIRPNTIGSDKRKRTTMLLFSVIAFVFVHMISQLFTTNYQDVHELINLIQGSCQYGVFALILGLNYFKTSDIKLNIAIHSTYNLMIFILMFLR